MPGKRGFAIAALIMLMIVPAYAASGDGPLHYNKVSVEPDGPNLNFTVYYETDFLTRLFSYIFGAKSLQGPLEGLFINFTDRSISSMDVYSGTAKVVAKNQSRLSGAWYVYDNDTMLASVIPVIEINAGNGTKTYNNTNSLPLFCYRA